ncbi:uncharacterized protein K460DRAFT_11555 [Cucurbitaria berberidis CBS 394.84]|uniref:Uncharacterized protein n=1 Tax=Cucurbitaria berberidis CBS 394.84 TaxID=1168544 RepID=A0A9P4GR41_9PLEO|nr:uncharacterized protein K460DRAFT_11555 [Cucurbitaria berberidis CBS 394.84]KAF1850185.1 hypothetical protein K460DRAFT_11555 [Cucurbitaria berberidis CBS 394.84]
MPNNSPLHERSVMGTNHWPMAPSSTVLHQFGTKNFSSQSWALLSTNSSMAKLWSSVVRRMGQRPLGTLQRIGWTIFTLLVLQMASCSWFLGRYPIPSRFTDGARSPLASTRLPSCYAWLTQILQALLLRT